MSQTQSSSPLLTTAQLVPVDLQYPIGKANMRLNLDKLPCPAEYKIISEILKRHVLKDALTVTASAPNIIGHEGKLEAIEKFYIKNLTQPWKTMIKMLNRCATSKITSLDQASLSIFQMFYTTINNCHVDYAKLIWDGIHYQILHPSFKTKVVIPYPRYTKLIIQHSLESHPLIPKRLNEHHHTSEDGDFVGYMLSNATETTIPIMIPDTLLT
ncbi:hypothetical protein Tco_1304742 [Tanacetum coccineum]